MNRLLATLLTAGTCVAAAAVMMLPDHALAQGTLKSITDSAKKAVDDTVKDTNKKVAETVKTLVGDDAPLPTDPRLVRGELPNGLKYIVVRHGKPEGHAAMWLHVASGSMNEKETQRGLAHYLEHLAFNGTEHFPPGTLVKYFESIGMRFGGDLNAFTNTDQTTYQLNVPFTDEESVAKGLTFLSDVAFRMSLIPEEIDAERQIILNEKMTRNGAGQRIGDYVSKHLVPGSLIGERLTIGTDERIKGAQKPDFVDYYSHWYVASNMTVIVVADTSTDQIVAQIKTAFADGKKVPKPTPADPMIRPFVQTRAIVATDKELEGASLQVMRLLPGIPPTTTEDQWRRDMVTSLASSAFNRRMQTKITKGGMAFTSANAGAGRFHHEAAFSVSSRCSGKAENWRAMLDTLGTEVQRARLHGFTQRELDDLKTQRISGAENAVQRESGQTAAAIIRGIDSSVTSGETIMSAAQELELVKHHLPTISVEEVSRRFAELYEATNVVYVLELPASATAPTEAELISLGTNAFSVKPEKEAETARATTLIEKLPEAGKVVDSSEHAESKVWSGWLNNGIRVHQRTMDEQKDQVTISITFAGGTIQETAENRGITSASELAWSRPATSKLSSTDIRDLMTGKKVNVGGGGGFGGGGGRGGGRGGRGGGGGGGLDTVSLRVSGNPSDLEVGMQLAYLMLTDPVIEPAAFDQWKTRQLQSLERREKNLQGVAGLMTAKALYPASEVRLQPITAAQINKITREDAQAWLKKIIATAPVEVSVVGDLPRERAIELVTHYLGSLPDREKIGPTTLASLRKVPLPKGPIYKDQTVDTATDQAIVRAGFFGPDASNLAEVRAMQMAANILSTRMVKTIREEKNLVYSIGASFTPGRSLPGFGTFSAGAPAEPGNATPLAKTIHELFTEFAANGPTEAEMTVVKKQVANGVDEAMKSTGFWMGATSLMDYHGTNIDDALAAPKAMQAITAEQVHKTFAKYCKEDAWTTFIVRPSEVTKKGDGGKNDEE